MPSIEKTIARLFETQNLSFIGTVDADGYPSIRAMLRPRHFEGVHTIYFSTNAPTNKIRDLHANPKACVYVCDPMRFDGALLKGTMEILEDPQHKELLWRNGDTLYYPGGVTDPGYVVLRFTAVSARVYGDFTSRDLLF